MSLDRFVPSEPPFPQPTLFWNTHIRRAAPLLLPALLMEACWLILWRVPTIATNVWALQLLFAVAFAGYIWALFLIPVTAQLTRWMQMALVLGGSLIFHLTLLPAPFALSDDMFRYVWDGRVSAANIDPYRYAPGDPALAPLRDEAIWGRVNAKEQPSPYPPLLEATFALIYKLRPESVLAVKTAMVAINLAAIGLLMVLLQSRQQPPARALIYAWSPQVVLQVAFSSHNEPILIFWLLLALLFGTYQSVIIRGKLLGPFVRLLGAWALALATLAKLAPVFALPLLLRRWGWRAAIVYGATVAAVYGALVLRGQRVFDGALFEAQTAQFNDGLHYAVQWITRYAAPGLVELVSPLLIVVAMGIVIVLLLRERSDDLAPAIGTVLASYVVLAASVAPWYTLWVLPFVALDVLPRLPGDHRTDRQRLLGSYWIIFSWTAIFSEVFYTASTPVWRVFHIAEYVLPVAVLGISWWWANRRRVS